MADAYKGFAIQFGDDTTDLSSRLPSLRRDFSEVERELRAIYRTPELGPGNVELLGQRIRYSSEQANILREHLNLVNAALTSGGVKRGSPGLWPTPARGPDDPRRLPDTMAAVETTNGYDAA
ncbi:MAG TPA: hypothetical protein IAA22_05475 [Candidatus Olsenella stercoravium]|uniref:Uncharacterized protein n=1 Tax=Candidatus Olsenella stercoravium TaxID=2838713 RepID=A0A9D2IQ05_9ACTN|nr:hypothetical protein [Candidatus Olsenella stercoravium]